MNNGKNTLNAYVSEMIVTVSNKIEDYESLLKNPESNFSNFISTTEKKNRGASSKQEYLANSLDMISGKGIENLDIARLQEISQNILIRYANSEFQIHIELSALIEQSASSLELESIRSEIKKYVK